MKTLIIVTICLIVSSRFVKAQTFSDWAPIISCGGTVTSPGNFEGVICIGLPCAGIMTDGTDTTFLGLMIPQPPGSDVAIPSGIEIIGNLYPNPTTGTFTAQLPADFGIPERILLLDDQGKTVRDLTSEVTIDGLNVNCKLPAIADGAYFFRVESKTQSLIYKVLVKK
jgi:hypothetical protein